MASGDLHSVARVEKAATAVFVPLLAAVGLDLEDLVVTQAGEKRIIKVVVDRDGGTTLDELATLTGVADAELVELREHFALEITSPGVGRPLTLSRHWRRSVGRKVSVDFSNTDTPQVVGRIGISTDTEVTLVVREGKTLTEKTFCYADISKAVVNVDFSSPSADELARCGLTVEEIAARTKGNK